MRLHGRVTEAPTARAVWDPGRPVNLALTLATLRRGQADVTFRIRPDGVWRATRTPCGPATQRLRRAPGGCLEVTAWGPGAGWAAERAATLCGGLDEDFRFADPLLSRIQRALPGLRIPRTEAVLEALVPAVLEQKVQGMEAWLAYRQLVRELGEAAPGPAGLWVPPEPRRLAETPYTTFHRFGVERRRADAIRNAAAHAGRLEEIVDMEPDAARRRLLALPGVGRWTAAEVAFRALGDPDAVSVGDFHLPHVVAFALAGERRASDERMLELLEPFRGQRGRAVQLIEAGVPPPARRAPRQRLRKIARM